jgi:amino acid transporter
MIGELSSSLPAEGGYYAWVRRGLGNFWGFQEAWLSLAASIFDMAIYPTLFGIYLKQMSPWFGSGNHAVIAGLFVVVTCAVLNVAGIRVVGITSLWLFFLLSAPFAVIVVMAPFKIGAIASGHGGPETAGLGLVGGVLVAMWNYMGWDNASTVAQEVVEPQRNYPRAMLLATGLVALTYVLPLAAVGLAGIPAEQFSTGAWADAARELVGPWLALCVVLGGTINGFGMFNALMMSYTRVPYALAEEGMLPKVVAKRTQAGVPWVSVALCSIAWALALGMSFERLISIDLVLYGAALVLEFVALVVLRVKEPELLRPFQVPGGLWGAVAVGVGPTLLIAFALWAARGERVAGLPALGFAAIVAAAGPMVYLGARSLMQMRIKTP